MLSSAQREGAEPFYFLFISSRFSPGLCLTPPRSKEMASPPSSCYDSICPGRPEANDSVLPEQGTHAQPTPTAAALRLFRSWFTLGVVFPLFPRPTINWTSASRSWAVSELVPSQRASRSPRFSTSRDFTSCHTSSLAMALLNSRLVLALAEGGREDPTRLNPH